MAGYASGESFAELAYAEVETSGIPSVPHVVSGTSCITSMSAMSNIETMSAQTTITTPGITIVSSNP